MSPASLSTHMCIFFFFSPPVLKDPWPCPTLERSNTKDVIVLALEKDNACLSSLGAAGGLKEIYSNRIVQGPALNASCRKFFEVTYCKGERVCCSEISLQVWPLITLVSFLLFSQAFSKHWCVVKNGVFLWLRKWNVLLPLNYGTACPQNRFCKCRAVNCGW